MVLIGLSHFSTAQEYLPKSKGEVVTHTYYTLSYLEDFEQAEWVYYTLTPKMLGGNVSRTDNFRADPKVFTGSAQLADYKHSNYDRGHLLPAGDMKMNRVAMSESFYISNMSPQLPSFNRGIWKQLEALVRSWASREKEYIVTGGILTEGLQEIGIDKVDIPKYFYKVIYNPNKHKMIAFVLPNEKGKKSLKEYVVSVDEVEKLTNIDFFSQLSDAVEKSLESKVDLSDWTFSISKSSYTSTNTLAISSSQQCKGIAKSTGKRCKNKTKNENGYCYTHQNQSPNHVKPKVSGYIGRCNAITQKGTRCKRKASGGTHYCWQHQSNH